MAASMKEVSPPQKMAAVSIIVVFVGAFLPWASFLGINVSGISGDGRLTLILSLIGAAAFALGTRVLGAAKMPRRAYLISTGAAAVLVALVALVDMSSIAAIGIYLTLLAGLAWVSAVIWDWRTPQTFTDPAGAPPPGGQGT